MAEFLKNLASWFWPRNVDPRGKAVLVTGCDSGFGKEIALALHAEGFLVFAACLTAEGSTALSMDEQRLRPFTLNVTSAEDVRQAVGFVADSMPDGTSLWCLINNAGVAAMSAPSSWLPISQYERTLEVNLLGQVQMTDAFLPMLAESRGRILFMVSILGCNGIHSTSAYCSSKFALGAYISNLRKFVGHKVAISAVIPGYHRTAIVDADKTWRDIFDAWENRIPDEVHDEHRMDSFMSKRKSFIPQYTEMLSANNEVGNVVHAVVKATKSENVPDEVWIGLDAFAIRWFFARLPSESKVFLDGYMRMRVGDGYASKRRCPQ